MPAFSHLHTHTEYSLLDGLSGIDKLYKKAIEDAMPALAITDHGNMFGVFRFVAEACKHRRADGSFKVKPICGCEFYLVADRRVHIFTRGNADKRYHQVMLAKNKEGYENLMRLCSLGYAEGLYGKYPRIDKYLIEKYHQGLIATTCCLGAIIPQLILEGNMTQAEAELKWWYNMFGEDYYIELQRHHLPEQDKVNEVLLSWAKKYGIKTIATNDAHYVDKEDASLHDILLCINTGDKLSTSAHHNMGEDDTYTAGKKRGRFSFPNQEFYLKTTDEMTTLFQDIPEAIDNTNEIVDKIQPLSLIQDICLPHFPVPKEFLTQDAYLRHLAYEGAMHRYSVLEDSIKERLDFELGVIEKMGFSGYFLIVADFIEAARARNIFVGPGRGSAAGSVVAYCVGITNIDPIKYNLLFERFLNPDRKSLPDIDTDFDDEGRDTVINYVCDKYGKQQVAKIITYISMGAKMAIKDIARVRDFSLDITNKITGWIPLGPNVHLQHLLHSEERALEADFSGEQMEGIRKLRSFYKGESTGGIADENDQAMGKQILKEATQMEGTVRNTSTHAAGIIIAPVPLDSIIPLCRIKEEDLMVAQIEGADIEAAGVIKMDFLGLRTLTILKRALAIIEQKRGEKINIDSIPLDDKATFELYQKADTLGTFQFESAGMRKYLRELKPDSFEDLIAMNALFRPGPMDYIPSYIRRKHGLEPIHYDLPEMEPYLKDTYGITVYQEQVMLLAQELADFTKGDADVLRKAMGKKQKSVLDKMKITFIENGQKKGHPSDILNKIWTDWEAFASYAFNKSHSTCYSFLAYQTAYLKANYYTEYMAALLDYTDTAKVNSVIAALKGKGIAVLAPDVNESEWGFVVNKEGQIRFGFKQIKGLGACAEHLIAERKRGGNFTSIFNLLERLPLGTLNKRSLEALIYAGAFDNFSKDIPRLLYVQQTKGETLSNLQKILRYAELYHKNKQQENHQPSLFSTMAEEAVFIEKPELGVYVPIPLEEMLQKEREHTSFYLSAHPLDNFLFEQTFCMPINAQMQAASLKEVMDFGETIRKEGKDRQFQVMGLLNSVEHKTAKNGRGYARFFVEDYTDKIMLMLYREEYDKYRDLLQENTPVLLHVHYQQRYDSEEWALRMLYITPLANYLKKATNLHLYLNAALMKETHYTFLKDNINHYPGTAHLHLHISDEEHKLSLSKMQAISLHNNTDLKQWLLQKPEVLKTCVVEFA